MDYELLEVIRERNEAIVRAERAEAQLARCLDALIWCSASPSFAPEGEARDEWERRCEPLIGELHRTGDPLWSSDVADSTIVTARLRAEQRRRRRNAREKGRADAG